MKTEPKAQWISTEARLPKYPGICIVWAIVNIGTPHETKSIAFVRYEPEVSSKWTDLQGDAVGNEITILKWLELKSYEPNY